MTTSPPTPDEPEGFKYSPDGSHDNISFDDSELKSNGVGPAQITTPPGPQMFALPEDGAMYGYIVEANPDDGPSDRVNGIVIALALLTTLALAALVLSAIAWAVAWLWTNMPT